MYKGCCYFNDGTYSNTIALKTVDEVLGYIKLQIVTGKEARILDDQNNMIMKIIGDQVVFPESCRKKGVISGERDPELKEAI